MRQFHPRPRADRAGHGIGRWRREGPQRPTGIVDRDERNGGIPAVAVPHAKPAVLGRGGPFPHDPGQDLGVRHLEAAVSRAAAVVRGRPAGVRRRQRDRVELRVRPQGQPAPGGYLGPADRTVPVVGSGRVQYPRVGREAGRHHRGGGVAVIPGCQPRPDPVGLVHVAAPARRFLVDPSGTVHRSSIEAAGPFPGMIYPEFWSRGPQGQHRARDWVTEGQNKHGRGATRPLESRLGAARPEYSVRVAHKARRWWRNQPRPALTPGPQDGRGCSRPAMSRPTIPRAS